MPLARPHRVVLILDPTHDPASLAPALDAMGLHLLHRLGRDVAVAASREAPATLAGRLPAGVRLLGPADVAALKPATAALLRGWQRRSTDAYRRAQQAHPLAGRRWGSDELPAPHADEEGEDDDHGPAGTLLARSATRAAGSGPRLPNDRLVNDVAVVSVFVEGPGSLDISAAEKDAVMEDIDDGLDWLGDQEPAARVSWHYVDPKSVSVSITPWQGARWPGLTEPFYAGRYHGTDAGIDAAFVREDNGKLYVFRSDLYARYSGDVANGPDAGYPKPISEGWKGLPASWGGRIDTGFARESDGRVYLFRGKQVVRFSNVADGVDAGWPKDIGDVFPGLPPAFADGFDAILQRKDNHKIYLFKGKQYLRYSNVANGVDPGYPKDIADGWRGLPDSYKDKGIRCALWRTSNGKIYFFRSSRWGGTYVRISDVEAGVDDGYPLPIGLSTDEAEALWREPAMAKLGYAAGQAGIEQLLDEACTQTGAPRAVLAYFTKQPTTWYAYAKKGRLVVRRSSFQEGDNVGLIAHETAHKFGAKDEYASSGCTCTSTAGWFGRANGNCENCNPSPQPCVMRNNTLAMCDDTPWHLGWGAFMERIDAAFWRHDNGRAYLFSNGWYARYSNIADGMDEGYPKPVKGNFKGLPAGFDRPDATVWRPDNNKLYFFKGSQYVRFSDLDAGVDPGYPKPIAGNWKGLPVPFQRDLDAVVWREDNNKLYFFKGSQYVRFSDVGAGMDAGYPLPIEGRWKGLTGAFKDSVDAGLMRMDTHQLYFFKGRRYVRFSDVPAGVDAGYPASIDGRWMPFPR